MTNKEKVLNRLVVARDQVASTIPSLTAILDEGIGVLQNETCTCGECIAILENVAALCEVILKPNIEKHLKKALGIPELNPIFDPQDEYDFKVDLPPYMRSTQWQRKHNS